MVQSPGYLKYAYTKLSLPAINLYSAKLTLNYLMFNQAQPLLDLYSPIELGHLRDVKRLTDINRVLFAFSLITLLVLRKSSLARHSLVYGATGVIILVFIIFITALSSWDFFFIGFHRLFFPQGNWSFPDGSTLIQLFPEAFWFMAFRNVALLTLALAAAAIVLGLNFSHSHRRHVLKTIPNPSELK